MLRRPFHLPSVVSLILCAAAVALWVRSAGSGPGDHLGWKRQQMQGKDFVHDEWSARSANGRVELVHFVSSAGPQGQTAVKAHIRFGEEGFFWTPAIEKPAAEKSNIDIQKKAPAPTTAPATQPAAARADKAFAVIDETSASARTRGVTVTHWLLVLVTALLPVRWFAVVAVRNARGEAGAPDGADRVPLLARLFATFASLSLLLAFVLGVGWVKSWYGGDRISWRDANQPRFVDLHSGRGQFVLHYRSVADEKQLRTAPDLAAAANGFAYRQDGEGHVGYTGKTFCFENTADTATGGAGRTITFAAPYWAIVIGTLLLPSWWLRNQKFGPIKVTSLGKPAGGKGKPVSAHSFQRPL